MPHTAGEPSQLAVDALFAKKERRNMSLRQIKTRDLCFTPSWLDSPQIESPPPLPSGIKPPSGYEFISPFKIPLLLQTLMPIEPRLLPSFPKHFFSLGNGRKRRSPWEFGKIV